MPIRKQNLRQTPLESGNITGDSIVIGASGGKADNALEPIKVSALLAFIASALALAPVAASGDYNDLSNLPSLGALAPLNVGAGLTSGDGALNANVLSVAGRTGAVTLSAADVSGLHAVATSGLYSALSGLPELSVYAPLASPALIGIPTAPTAAALTNTTQIATTAFVRGEITGLLDAAPAALDTLNELAAALGDDPNFATTITNALALKAPLASPILTGAPQLAAALADSLAINGATLGANKFAVAGSADITGNLTLGASSLLQFSTDAILGRAGAGAFQFGGADSASPVQQILQPQSRVAGATNSAAPTFLIQGPRGTGNARSYLGLTAAVLQASGTLQQTYNTLAGLFLSSDQFGYHRVDIRDGAGNARLNLYGGTTAATAGIDATTNGFFFRNTNGAGGGAIWLTQVGVNFASSIDGIIAIGANFNDANYPGFQRNGTRLAFRLSNNSDDTDISARSLWIKDGMTAPAAATGYAKLYVDTADGDLKVIFADGTIKTIVVDT